MGYGFGFWLQLARRRARNAAVPIIEPDGPDGPPGPDETGEPAELDGVLMLGAQPLSLGSETLTLSIPPLAVHLAQLANGTVTSGAAQGTDLGTLFATGGVAPYTFAISGADAAYFQLNADGTTTEASATAMLYADAPVRYLTATVTDSFGSTAQDTFPFEVATSTTNDTDLPSDGFIVETPTFDGAVSVSNMNGGLKFKGKATGEAKFVYSIGRAAPGGDYIFRYDPDFSLLANGGKNALIGIGFKSGGSYHFTGLRGDGGAGLKVDRLHGTSFTAPPTVIAGAAPAHGTQAGPNWLRLQVATDGSTYILSTSADGVAWTVELLDALPVPLGASTSALEFGLAAYLAGNDTGHFAMLVTAWTGEPAELGTPVAVTYLWTGAQATDGVTVGVKLEANASARMVASTQSDLSSPIYGAAVATVDRLAILSIDGLEPNTAYHYGVETGGVVQALRGKFRTLPDGPASFTIALGSCAGTGSTALTFDAIRERDPLAFIHMGDLHYANISVNSVSRFHTAFDNVFASARQHRLYREVPTYYMGDDHDTGADNTNANSPSIPAACLAYRERVPSPPLAQASGSRHSSFQIGRVLFVLTDLRAGRSPQTLSDSASKTMLGAAQKAWFKALMTEAGADPDLLVVWISTVPWTGVANQGSDAWRGYATERAELANHIKAAGLIGRIFIGSGDMHALAMDSGANGDFATGGGSRIPVFQAAPLHKTSTAVVGEYDILFPTHASDSQYGLITFTDDGFNLSVTWSAHTASGTLVRSYTFAVFGMTVSGASVAQAREGQAYAGFTVAASGGVEPYGYSVASGALPAGITLDADTGEVSGTPTVPGSYSAVIRATDAESHTADLAAIGIVVFASGGNQELALEGETLTLGAQTLILG